MDEPTDDELIRFAAELLGHRGPFVDEELLRNAVREARDLWLRLYEASRRDRPPPPE